MTCIQFFFIFTKGFYKSFQKYRFFEIGGFNLKIGKFGDSHFVERVILHVYWSFLCGLLSPIFGEFPNIEPILVKLGVK